MSSQEEVDEWRSKPKTMGGVNEHVYWGYPNDPAEVTHLSVHSIEITPGQLEREQTGLRKLLEQ